MKRSLIISGGGSKGAFAVGVLKRLTAEYSTLNFDSYVGTSTGSLIVPLAAIEEYDLLEKVYTSKTTNDIVEKFNLGNRLNQTSIFGVTPLWNLIVSIFTNEKYDKLIASGKKIYITTTCLQTGALCIFTNDIDHKKSNNYEVMMIANADHCRKAMLASACQPVFMTPIKVNKDVPGYPNPGFQYVDGGVREYAGVEIAIDNGAEELFTILLSSGKKEVQNIEFTSLFPILEKTIDIFVEDVAKNDLIIPAQYNEALLYIDAVKRKMKRAGIASDQVDEYFRIKGRESPFEEKIPLKLYNFRPTGPLGGGPGGMEFIPAEMKKMVAAGQKVSTDFIASLNPKDVTWA